jgi:dTMP kinase
MKKKSSGFFITFEGGEGTGKSVQSSILCEKLKAKGFSVVLTREPGGTEGAEEIRKLLLVGDEDKWGIQAESLLYLASRADHWEKVIEPALSLGKIVIADRFHDSSVIYQGYCKGVPKWFLNNAYRMITGGRLPNRTYLIDIDPKIGIKRSIEKNNNENNNEVRYENMDIDFHNNVRKGFLNMANNDKRFLIVDGHKEQSVIADEIYSDIAGILGIRR